MVIRYYRTRALFHGPGRPWIARGRVEKRRSGPNSRVLDGTSGDGMVTAYFHAECVCSGGREC
jgi:hypothetical protein